MEKEHVQRCSNGDLAHSALDVDLQSIGSVALARLVEEVRVDCESTLHSYDRVHNRHNR